MIIVQNHHKERVYSEHDRDLLMTIASSAAVALQNARLFSEKQEGEIVAAERAERIKSLLLPVLESVRRIERLARPADQIHSGGPALREISGRAAEIQQNLAGILSMVDQPSQD